MSCTVEPWRLNYVLFTSFLTFSTATEKSGMLKWKAPLLTFNFVCAVVKTFRFAGVLRAYGPPGAEMTVSSA